MPASIRLLLVCQHSLVREGLRLLMHRAADMLVVGEASGRTNTLSAATRLTPDVVVLDAEPATADSASLIRELGQRVPQSRMLVLTGHGDREQLLTWIRAGAHGCIGKDVESAELVAAIRAVAGGETYARPTPPRLHVDAGPVRSAASTARSRFETLSEREQTVLRSVAQGYSGVEISRSLGISGKTVDAYKRRIENKLGLSHRADYVRFGIEAGILGA